MTNCPIVVIGHVDHGKTALVKALTGTDTDRLAEEKRRGLSITPGFAHRTYPAGTMDFIDAPGHEDFIRAMISAASGAQAALLVISSSEGIAAQTLEHLRIAELLGIRHGVVALSKSDMLDDGTRADRIAEIRTELSGTVFAEAKMVSCSAHTGEGLDALDAALADLVMRNGTRNIPIVPFLPIDRVFTVQGRGVVVTGTLHGGRMSEGDTLILQPRGQAVTVRSLQCRGAQVQNVDPGARTAANLRGVTAVDIAAGDVLTVADGTAVSTTMDIELSMLSGSVRPIRHMQKLRVFIGTATAIAKVRILQASAQTLHGGQTAFARLHFDTPQVAYAGERAVLRHLSPAQTVAGAVILDPVAPPLRRRYTGSNAILEAARTGEVPRIIEALTTVGRGVAALPDIARLSRITPDEVRRSLSQDYVRLQNDLILDRTVATRNREYLLTALADFHREQPLKFAAPRTLDALTELPQAVAQYLETSLLSEGLIRRDEDGIALADHDPMQQLCDGDRKVMLEIEAAFLDAGLSPPDLSAVSDPENPDVVALLIRSGTLVRLRNVGLNQTILFHAQAIAAAQQTLQSTFPPPVWFRTSEARVALGTSRKFIVPLLESFDASGITHRVDARRQMKPA